MTANRTLNEMVRELVAPAILNEGFWSTLLTGMDTEERERIEAAYKEGFKTKQEKAVALEQINEVIYSTGQAFQINGVRTVASVVVTTATSAFSLYITKIVHSVYLKKKSKDHEEFRQSMRELRAKVEDAPVKA